MFRDGGKALYPRDLAHGKQLLLVLDFGKGGKPAISEGKKWLVIHAHSLMAFLGKDPLLRGLEIGAFHEKQILKRIER